MEIKTLDEYVLSKINELEQEIEKRNTEIERLNGVIDKMNIKVDDDKIELVPTVFQNISTEVCYVDVASIYDLEHYYLKDKNSDYIDLLLSDEEELNTFANKKVKTSWDSRSPIKIKTETYPYTYVLGRTKIALRVSYDGNDVYSYVVKDKVDSSVGHFELSLYDELLSKAKEELRKNLKYIKEKTEANNDQVND